MNLYMEHMETIEDIRWGNWAAIIAAFTFLFALCLTLFGGMHPLLLSPAVFVLVSSILFTQCARARLCRINRRIEVEDMADSRTMYDS